MKLQLRKFMISIILFGIAVVGSVGFFFEKPEKILFAIANTKPISAIINKLQHYSIPQNNAECLKQLKQSDADFRIQADFDQPSGCKVEFAVRLARVGNIKIENAPLLTCRMAAQLLEFESDIIQPTAQRFFGSEVNRMGHLGTYNCRGMRQFSRILSQHAFANAIDVSGFDLKDGQSISVQKDWKLKSDKSLFLKEISSAACDTFRVSVSPDGDANHWNHFHWDMGPYGSCR